MDEILALQAALATAQDTKSSIRLSERNIVELVNKLKSLDLLDDTLLYTLNGKEYLTEARLDAEIKREVKRSGGRVPVTDLQPALNVDVAHCERRARALAADASNGVALVEGELITPAYFDAVAAETDEELREAGVIGVGELARRHGLSADLMTKALRERVEAGAVDGRLEGGSIYTPGYVRRLRAQLRGAMRAALVPTTRDALVATIEADIQKRKERAERFGMPFEMSDLDKRRLGFTVPAIDAELSKRDPQTLREVGQQRSAAAGQVYATKGLLEDHGNPLLSPLRAAKDRKQKVQLLKELVAAEATVGGALKEAATRSFHAHRLRSRRPKRDGASIPLSAKGAHQRVAAALARWGERSGRSAW